MNIQRLKPMSHQEWTEIVLGWRRPEITRLVAVLGEDATADLVAAYRRKDMHAVDRELTKLGSPP